MSAIPRCWICKGPILGSSCLHCGRALAPERVSLGEALIDNMRPTSDASVDVSSSDRKNRQQIPLSVSLERAKAWGRGEEA